MARIEALLFDFAFLGYLAALGFYAAYAFTRRDSQGDTGRMVLGVSCALHGAGLLLGLWSEAHRADHIAYAFWTNWFTSLSLFAFFIAFLFLLIQIRARMAILGIFILPLVVFPLGLAVTQAFLASPRCPFASVEDFLRAIDSIRRAPGLPPTLLSAVHVPLLFLAYAALANAFGIGIAYILGERQLKNHRPTKLSYRLPSLEEMDNAIARLVLVAFPALTLGLALGAQWAISAGAARWAVDPKVIWSLFIWAVYLAYLVLRYGAGWRGRRTTYLSLAGFGLALFTYFGVSYFSRFHGFLYRGAG